MKYDIWIDNQEQWDANDIDAPLATYESYDPGGAAVKFMEAEGEMS